jgi:hypothetical protein
LRRGKTDSLVKLFFNNFKETDCWKDFKNSRSSWHSSLARANPSLINAPTIIYLTIYLLLIFIEDTKKEITYSQNSLGGSQKNPTVEDKKNDQSYGLEESKGKN